uniref:Uncharacterized protein n=1 Tax=Kalanchoe fedtschenkoi TaxID=63787 RepID=A0A7N1A7P7_KALFE
MRREGRQHGMMRTYRIIPSPLNPRSSPISAFDSAPTAGMFTKLNPSKPTNHSKFTGKCGKAGCGQCHLHPACKSREKTKGSHKARGPNDDVSRLKLVSWRVVDARPGLGLSFAGSSASQILAHLAEEEESNLNDVGEYGFGFDRETEVDGGKEIEIEEEKMDGGDADEDETMSFCEVGYVWEQVEGDDSWCLVAEM